MANRKKTTNDVEVLTVRISKSKYPELVAWLDHQNNKMASTVLLLRMGYHLYGPGDLYDALMAMDAKRWPHYRQLGTLADRQLDTETETPASPSQSDEQSIETHSKIDQ